MSNVKKPIFKLSQKAKYYFNLSCIFSDRSQLKKKSLRSHSDRIPAYSTGAQRHTSKITRGGGKVTSRSMFIFQQLNCSGVSPSGPHHSDLGYGHKIDKNCALS